VNPRTTSGTLTSVARWVSIVAHPFVTALVLAWGVERERGIAAATRTTLIVGGLFVLPLVALTARQVRSGAWSTVDASQVRERPILFAVGAAALLALMLYFSRAQPGTPLIVGTAGVLTMLALCAAVTTWVKVSLHVAAAALAATVLLLRHLPLGGLLVAVLPVLMWSRVALGRHRRREVALGLVMGAITGLVIVRIT
jgi:hypothetical protein